MSKIEKFFSIGIGIFQKLQATEKNQFNMEGITAKQLCNAMKEIEIKLAQKNIQFSVEAQEHARGEICIHVMDEEGVGIPAQVKFFPLSQGETLETYNTANGKINIIRETTDENGMLYVSLLQNQYMVEISKGSEYEIISTPMYIGEKENGKKEYILHRFVHLPEQHYFAGDVHHHSIFSSPVYGGDDDVKESPAEVANSMRAMGLTFGALSDHHNILNHSEWTKQEMSDFHPIVSKEISTSNGHVASIGVEKDVVYHIPKAEDRTDTYLRGEFQRIVLDIKEAGGLAQLNHPRDLSVSISWNPDFYDMIDIFESMEIWNGSNPMCDGTTNAEAVKLWIDLLNQGRYIPATSGSDTHNIKANDYHIIMDEIQWFVGQISHLNMERELPEYRKEIQFFQLLAKKILPTLEKWAETNLTSGCVRTYVYLPEGRTTKNILQAMRQGNSFLTNGPIIIPKINGASCGEKTVRQEETLEVELLIMSNKPLAKLQVYGSDTYSKQYLLVEKNETVGLPYYDYSMHLPLEDASKGNWIFFVVADDFTNMAITNPIFLNR